MFGNSLGVLVPEEKKRDLTGSFVSSAEREGRGGGKRARYGVRAPLSMGRNWRNDLLFRGEEIIPKY